jgi:hypothetical protein
LADIDPDEESGLKTVARREWALFGSSRGCGRCLAEDRAWPLWWRLGLAAVCPEHLTLLAGTCPACGTALRAAPGGRARALSVADVPDLTVCGAPTGSGPCLQPLAQLPVIPVHSRLASDQRVLLGVAADGGTVAGVPTSAADWFAAARQLATAVRFSLTVDGLEALPAVAAGDLEAYLAERDRPARRGAFAPLYGESPRAPAVAAGLLATVMPILSSTNQADLEGRLGPLVDAVAARRAALGRDPLRRMTFPDPLRTAWVRLDRGGAGALRRRSRLAAGPPVSLDRRWIPEIVPAAMYDELFAALLPTPEPVTGRRFVALAVARCAAPGPGQKRRRSWGSHVGGRKWPPSSPGG